MDTSTLRQDMQSLVEKFDRDKHHYLSKDYLEAQCRQDFIDPLFEALGWDISNKAGLPPLEREVLLEKGETSGRPDYNFRLGGASKFFVEAKAPPESLDSVRHVLQAKSYAWNTKEVFIAVLTDFEGLKVFDASLTPDRKNPLQGLIIDLKYTEYLNNLDKLLLLSREAVSQGSLERLLLRDAKSKRQRIPVDKKFLQDMGLWREGLAKDVYRHDPSISVRTLNEVVQRLLDRIVFIRIAEDRKIIEPRTLFEIAQLWKAEGKKRPIQYHLNNLFREINADLNGDIFKSPHPCEQYEIDSALLAGIIEDLYFPNSPYLFDVIGVELLGSIYERYLGSTIRATPGGRVKVEEKPEVRKAGGVYYTPQYIVKYIVENTVGRLIEGKTPKQIEKIKVLDPACGSGSFLLGAYQYLIDYHIKYYREHPKEAHVHPLFPDLIGGGDPAGRPYRLSIIKKGHILRNNLFGVDIDPQAVEITMMSLYLKALEGERTLPRKQGLLPVLSDNIKCGNSLIGYDIFDTVGATHPCTNQVQGQAQGSALHPCGAGRVAPTKGQGILVGAGSPRPYITDEERERINPFDWDSKSAGFGEIMGRGGFDVVIGNPPWGQKEIAENLISKVYIRSRFTSSIGIFDLYRPFVELGIKNTHTGGYWGMVLPDIVLLKNYPSTRKWILENMSINLIDSWGMAFQDAVIDAVTIIGRRESSEARRAQQKIVATIREKDGEFHNVLLQRDLLKAQDFKFNLFLDASKSAMLKKLSKHPKFSALFEAHEGIHSGNVREKIFISRKLNRYCKPMIFGRDEVGRYYLHWNGKWVNRSPDAFNKALGEYANLGRQEWFEQPKLIIRRTGDRLVCGLDEEGYYFSNNVFVSPPLKDNNLNLRYVLGLLNSCLMTWFYLTIQPRKGRVFAEIKLKQISQLPIRTINLDNPKEKAMHDRLVTLVDRMLELNKKKHVLPVSSQQEMVGREIAVTDERIDDLVYELYGITKGEREIIEGGGVTLSVKERDSSLRSE